MLLWLRWNEFELQGCLQERATGGASPSRRHRHAGADREGSSAMLPGPNTHRTRTRHPREADYIPTDPDQIPTKCAWVSGPRDLWINHLPEPRLPRPTCECGLGRLALLSAVSGRLRPVACTFFRLRRHRGRLGALLLDRGDDRRAPTDRVDAVALPDTELFDEDKIPPT